MTQRRVGRQERRALPAPRPVLRGRQHQVLRRDPLPAARARLRRGPPLRRRLARVADLLRGPRALLHRGRAALPRARRGRRGPHRAAALGPVPVPGRLARAAHPAAPRRLRPHRPPPVPPAGGRGHERVRSRGRAAACAATASTASPASPTARPTPTCSACGRRSSTTNVTLQDATPRSSGSRPTPRAASCTGVVVDRRGATETYSGRRRGRAPAAPPSRRRCCCARPTTGTPTGWPTRPTRWAATTWPTSTRA